MTVIHDAARELREGGLVVIPTDTVYGLAALPGATGAIRALFELKGRPADKPVAILGPDLGSLRGVALIDEGAARCAEAFWPGPLTLVLARAPGFEHDLGGTDMRTVGVRVPASETTRALLRSVGPLAVTSANLSGLPETNTIEEARAALGSKVAVYVDGGPGAGKPSTVVSLVGQPRVLRRGAVTEAEVLAVLGS